MKRSKMSKNAPGLSENKPIEVSTQDLNLIRTRESSRIRRNNIEWFSL